MALKEKLDKDFTERLLKKTLIKSAKQTPAAANDDLLVSQDSIVKISNSLTSLQNSFNKIYAYSSNIRALHQFEEKRLLSIKKENNLENKIGAGGIPTPASGDLTGGTDIVDTFDTLSQSIDDLTQKLKTRGGSLGGGSAVADAAATALPVLLTLSKFGRKLLGPVGVGLDIYDRYSEGQPIGKIAAGVGGGLVGSVLGSAGGAAIGGAIGGLFGAGAGAIPGAAIGSFVGSIGGYLGGSYLGDSAYDYFQQRAAGGAVRAGGTYVVGERGPEVLVMNGRAGRVLSTGTKSSTRAERELQQAAERAAKGRAKLEKGRPLGDTSYSSKFSNYLRDTFQNVTSWVSRTGDFMRKMFGQTNTGDTGNYNAAGSSENAEIAINYFMSQGWTRLQAAAMVGVMQAESGYDLDPNAFNEAGGNLGAWGIAQWRGPRQAGANPQKALGVNSIRGTTLQQQLQYVNWELNNTHRSAGQELRRARTMEEAVNAFLFRYEGASTSIAPQEVKLGQRIANANALLNGTTSPRGRVALTGAARNLVMTSGTGYRELYGGHVHRGIDIVPRNPTGTTLIASATGGRVVYAGMGVSGSGYGNMGNVVSIESGGRYYVYAHLAGRPSVSVNDTVTPGTILGVMGSTGLSTGPHLHFEIRSSQAYGSQVMDTGALTRFIEQRPWVVGGNINTDDQQSDGQREQRPPARTLPAGYREGVNPLTRQPGVYTPSGFHIPASARNAGEVTGYNLTNRAGQVEIERYFQLRNR